MPLTNFLPRRKPTQTSAPAWAALARSGAGVVCAEVRREPGQRPRLVARQAFAGDRAWHEGTGWCHAQRGARISWMLAGSDYQLLPIEAPEVAPAERAKATRWRIKDLIDYPAEDAQVDCVRLPSPDGQGLGRQALAVVTRRSALAEWIARAPRDAQRADAIDILELALRNLATLLPGPAAHALLHIGLDGTTLVNVWQGELCSHRRFEVNAERLIDASAEDRELALERLGLEVQRSADAYERQFHASALGRLWVLEPGAGHDIAAALQRHVALRVERFDCAAYLDGVAAGDVFFDADAGIDYLPAIGAALRDDSADVGLIA